VCISYVAQATPPSHGGMKTYISKMYCMIPLQNKIKKYP